MDRLERVEDAQAMAEELRDLCIARGGFECPRRTALGACVIVHGANSVILTNANEVNCTGCGEHVWPMLRAQREEAKKMAGEGGRGREPVRGQDHTNPTTTT